GEPKGLSAACGSCVNRRQGFADRSELVEWNVRERSEDRQEVPERRRHHLFRGPQRHCGRISRIRGSSVADKRCENGHFIDESWDLCPYCPAEENEPEIPIVRPSRFGSPEARPASPPEPRRAPPTVPPTTAAVVPRRETTVPVQP